MAERAKQNSFKKGNSTTNQNEVKNYNPYKKRNSIIDDLLGEMKQGFHLQRRRISVHESVTSPTGSLSPLSPRSPSSFPDITGKVYLIVFLKNYLLMNFKIIVLQNFNC